jgi:hypothetical protein
LHLQGLDTLKRDLTASAKLLEALTPGFVAGDYRAAPIKETCGLDEAVEAYLEVAAGSAGRVVLAAGLAGTAMAMKKLWARGNTPCFPILR